MPVTGTKMTLEEKARKMLAKAKLDLEQAEARAKYFGPIQGWYIWKDDQSNWVVSKKLNDRNYYNYYGSFGWCALHALRNSPTPSGSVLLARQQLEAFVRELKEAESYIINRDGLDVTPTGGAE
jgi:hypothetical protein